VFRHVSFNRSISGMFALRTLLGLMLLLVSVAPVAAQSPTPETTASENIVEAMLKSMSGQQRVGQVFLASFPGTNASAGSDIDNLINTYHIGGVQLKASSQNVVNSSDVPVVLQVSTLANQLQQLAIRGETRIDIDSTGAIPITASAIIKVEPRSAPLFIGIAQDNDLGNTIELPEFTSGVTQVPNLLTIGATWKPQHARTVGNIIGSELAQMGINLYFGPALDVVDSPRPASPGDLGTRAFGGDPYWVPGLPRNMLMVCTPADVAGSQSLRATFRDWEPLIAMLPKKFQPCRSRWTSSSRMSCNRSSRLHNAQR
jgi:beta-N-acetylhexosaminidase